MSARRSAPSVKQVAAFHEIIRQAGGKSSAGACRNRAVRLHRDTRRLSIRETDAFDLGWDHGIYRVAPDPDLPAAVREGYLAASGSREPKQADRFVRKWLQMRAQAMLRGIQVDATITPATLESLDSTTCPISGVSLTHGECADTDWSVDRVLNRYGYRPGNLLIVSSRVNRAKGALGLTQLRRIASNPEHHPELEPREWHRLAEVVEMFEIAEADDPPKGLPRLTGQLPVNGLRLSSVAFWQQCVTLAVSHDDTHLLGLAVSQFPRGKPVRRATAALLKELTRRVSARAEPFGAWSSIRLQKRLDALLELLPASWYRRHAALSERFYSAHLGLAEARRRLRGVKR